MANSPRARLPEEGTDAGTPDLFIKIVFDIFFPQPIG
jgi:hypothetical protein